MKLLQTKEAQSKVKKESDELIEKIVRLRKLYADYINKFNTAKDNYDPEKLQKQAEFDRFCMDINIKREKLLSELGELEKLIEQKKELYYGLVEKQDEVAEKIYQINEREKKLDLRETFVQELEKKHRELTS